MIQRADLRRILQLKLAVWSMVGHLVKARKELEPSAELDMVCANQSMTVSATDKETSDEWAHWEQWWNPKNLCQKIQWIIRTIPFSGGESTCSENMNLDRKSAGQKVCKGHSRGPLCEVCTVNAASKGCTRTLSLGWNLLASFAREKGVGSFKPP